MATISKDSTTPRRERKSSMSPASTKRLTKPMTPDKPSSTSNSSSTAKSGPSYLRSTATSSRPTRQPLTRSGSLKKQQGSDNEESKSPKPTPTLNRRRSFDKPPSPSRLPRPNMSPGRDFRYPPQWSRSLSAKSVSNAPKPASKSIAGIKPQGSYAKGSGTGLRRSISGITTSSSSKKEVSRSSKSTTGGSKVPRSRDITQILNLEGDFEALDHQKIESIEDNSQELPDPKLAEEDRNDQHQDHDSDTGPDNDSAEEAESNVDATHARDEEVAQAEKNLDDQVEEVNNISKDHESNDIDQGSGLTSEETKTEEVIEEKKEDENNIEVDMEIVDGGSHELDPKQGRESDVKEEAKPEQPVPSKKPQAAAVKSNKKEAAPAYNDVIEETASKLMSQDQKRRNKVRALVGAFETVIDYESGSKQN